MRKLKTLNIRDMKHLCIHLRCTESELIDFCKNPYRHYYKKELKIKDKLRPIATPKGKFRGVTNNLQYLLNRIELPEYIQGGVVGYSNITNAMRHIGKPAVLNFDLKDFFPSIKAKMVNRLFRKRLGCSPYVSEILTGIVTLNDELPQGSPTSTVIANLVILPLSKRLDILSKKHNSGYGQFVDDGTLSGPCYIARLRKLIEKIIQQEGFEASPKAHKRKTMYSNEEQIVTGVRVNRNTDVPNSKVTEIKNELARLKDTPPEKVSDLEINSLRGKIQYAGNLNKTIGRRFSQQLKSLNRPPNKPKPA